MKTNDVLFRHVLERIAPIVRKHARFLDEIERKQRTQRVCVLKARLLEMKKEPPVTSASGSNSTDKPKHECDEKYH